MGERGCGGDGRRVGREGGEGTWGRGRVWRERVGERGRVGREGGWGEREGRGREEKRGGEGVGRQVGEGRGGMTVIHIVIGLYRDVQNESRDPFGGNVHHVTMQITFLTRKFRNGERNLHCDVVHITTKWVSSLTLDCNGVFAIKAYRYVH